MVEIIKKKMPRMTSWILRILLFFIVIIGLGLLMLSALSGTSESHRRGLQQAFSDFLQADVDIGSLNGFNIVPQLYLSADNVKVTSRTSLSAYEIEHVKLAFGFWDLLLSRKRIENFDLQNFHFVTGPDLSFDHIGIVPDKKILELKGLYQREKFTINVGLQQHPAPRPSYFFASENKLKGSFGQISLSGIFVPNAQDKQPLRKLAFAYQEKIVLEGAGEIEPDKSFVIKTKCAMDRMPAQAATDVKKLEDTGLLKITGDCAK